MPKKRYQSSEEIERDIDRCIAKAKRLLSMADALDCAADQLFQDPLMVEHAKAHRAAATAKRNTATRLAERKAQKLKEKLAEFNTMPMFGFDRSIPAAVRY